MEIEFHWRNKQDNDTETTIERNVEDLIVQQDMTPCHPGILKVYLDIVGPLDNRLNGYVVCQCEKKLLHLNGTSDASYLELINFNEEIK